MTSVDGSFPKTKVSNVWFDALTERQVVAAVRRAWSDGNGGSITTVNADIARAAMREPSLARLIAAGSLVVADGMPLVWAARLAGGTLPERVTGSSLLISLSEAAAADGRSVFVLGGADGVPDKAAAALRSRFSTLSVAGTYSPPFGFDQSDQEVRKAVEHVKSANPDLVFVGLGFPKQERLIEILRQDLPNAWYLGCGGGIAMAAGVLRRASPLMQHLGLEWVHRLALEPRRLAGRYLCDLPFATGMLVASTACRFKYWYSDKDR